MPLNARVDRALGQLNGTYNIQTMHEINSFSTQSHRFSLGWKPLVQRSFYRVTLPDCSGLHDFACFTNLIRTVSTPAFEIFNTQSNHQMQASAIKFDLSQ